MARGKDYFAIDRAHNRAYCVVGPKGVHHGGRDVGNPGIQWWLRYLPFHHDSETLRLSSLARKPTIIAKIFSVCFGRI